MRKTPFFKIILFSTVLFIRPLQVHAGLDKYSYLDKMGKWLIERRVDSSNGKISCRASIPGRGTWFSARIRLNKDDQLVIPKGLTTDKINDSFMIKKVKAALQSCRNSLIYVADQTDL